VFCLRKINERKFIFTGAKNHQSMSINKNSELEGMKRVSEAVGLALKAMREHTRPGMTTGELDDFGGQFLKQLGAKSAPKQTYGFPGYTCISINHEIAHGIPSKEKVIREGDLVNIDVSAELDGFWSDNGGSFVVGEDVNGHQRLVKVSRDILWKALSLIRGGVRISAVGKLIETEAKKAGYTVIRNLAGHGVGRSLHEEPSDILNYADRFNLTRFRKNTVVAVETFISTSSTIAHAQKDGWTLVGNKGGFVAQHEHTIVVTGGKPIILTQANGI
jgi:methionyl aminopeptidase